MNDTDENGMPWLGQSFDLAPMPPLPTASYNLGASDPSNGTVATTFCTETRDEEKLKRKREAARVRQQRCRHRKKAELRIEVQATVSDHRSFTATYLPQNNDVISLPSPDIPNMPPLVPLVVLPQNNVLVKDVPDLTSEEKLGRKREAARIRQQRYRARKKSNGGRTHVDPTVAHATSIIQHSPVPATPSTLDRFHLNGTKESISCLSGSIGSSSGVPSFLAMLGDADALSSHIDGDAYIDQIVADV